jgi:hypothetical protein
MAFKIITDLYVDKVVSGGTYNPSTSEITFTNTNNDTFVVTGITSGSTTNPAGLTTEIQYNNAGAFGADSGFIRNPLTGDFTVSHNTNGSSIQIGDGLSSGLIDGLVLGNIDTIVNGLASGYNNVTSKIQSQLVYTDLNTGEAATATVDDRFISYLSYSDNVSGSTKESSVEVSSTGVNIEYLEFGPDLEHQIRVDVNGISFDFTGESYTFPLTDGTANQVLTTDGAGQLSWEDKDIQSFQIAMSDETTDLVVGSSVTSFMIPNDFVVTEVMMFVNTAPVGSALIVDVNLGGTSIFSTRPQIDAGSSTSQGSVVTPVFSTTSFSKWNILTLDIDQIGSGTAGAGLKIILNGYYV